MKSQEIYFINREKERKRAAIITDIPNKKIFKKSAEHHGRHPFFTQGILFTCEIHSKVTKIVIFSPYK